MRLSYILVTILVILVHSDLSSAADENTIKRHISDSDDNLTLPKVGPALRPYTADPISDKLQAELVGKVNILTRHIVANYFLV